MRENERLTISAKQAGGMAGLFIKLFVGLLANNGGGGNVVNNCDGCDIVTPVALLVTYMGLVAYIVCGCAKSICNNRIIECSIT